MARSLPPQRDFLRLTDLERDELLELLERAAEWKLLGSGGPRPLERKMVALIFEKASTRTRVSLPVARTSPRSMANGPTPARMLPQFGVVSTMGLSIPTWQNRKSTSQPGFVERETIATLLVSGCAPPMPST